MSKHPYWRWWRYRRRRQPQGRGAVAKPWNGIIAVALLTGLVALDQATKHLLYIQFDWHRASDAWLLGAVASMACAYPLLFVKRLRLGATFLMAGIVGNALSVYLFGAAPNPFQLATGRTGNVVHLIAFNAADVYQYVGFALLILGAFQLLNDIRRQPNDLHRLRRARRRVLRVLPQS